MNTEKNILENLRSENPEVVMQSIEEIRESGTNIHLAALLQLLHDTRNKLIKKKIFVLLGELKSSETIPLLMDAIVNRNYAKELKDLVACCWQNGLNYNNYLPVFVDLVIHEDFAVAFEAVTVIENMYGRIDQDVIEQQLIKLREAPVSSNEQKNFLLDSLPSTLQHIPENQTDYNDPAIG